MFPELDPGHKRTAWETIVITTPVILTVVATILAGLSSSEMSSAQYFRSLAAQMQSKVSDQWGYFQAKKLRAEQCGNTVEIIRHVSQTMPMDANDFSQTISQLRGAMWQTVIAVENADLSNPAVATTSKQLSALLLKFQSATTRPIANDEAAGFMRGDIPEIQEEPIGNQQIKDTIAAVDSRAAEPDLEQQAGRIPPVDLDQAIAAANKSAAAFDEAAGQMSSARSQTAQTFDGISRAATAFERAMSQASDDVVAIEPPKSVAAIRELNSQLSGAVSIAGLNFNSNRYQRDAHYNQVLAELLEVEVRRQGFLSNRHRARSQEFFYGMLGAQAGVTIATFSLAVRRRNLLWGLAASAGLAAVTFAAYVYMFV